MKLQLVNTKVLSMTFDAEQIKEGEKKKVLNIEYKVLYNAQDKEAFEVVFDIFVQHEGEFNMKTKFAAYFRTSEEIDDKFKNSNFPVVNAPAIAFPFLRSFIGTMTINAGYNAVILPSINFVSLAEENKKKVKKNK